jgi:hypothetical protein
LLDDNYINSFGFAIAHPLSYVYLKWNKTERSRRMVYQYDKEEEELKKCDYKYSREKVSEWTGLKGAELYDFIVYCDIKSQFIKENTEFDIICTINKKLLEYKKLHNKNLNDTIN